MIVVAVVDFFAGCGGTSLGLRDAGLDIAAAVDNDPIAARSYSANFPQAHMFEKDIRELTVAELSKAIPDGPLLFAGCAPCQPFSKQNRGRSALDPRRNLLSSFQLFVEQFLPDYVLVENVPGIQKLEGSRLFQQFVASLKRRSYKVDVDVVSALDFGVAQTRRRLVLVASRVGQPELSKAVVEMVRPRTVRDEIWDLPRLAAGETDPQDVDHVAMRLSPINLRRIQQTPEGGTRASWVDDELILDCHRDHNGHTDVYGRLAWDKPATAMTTRCISYSNGRFGHPDQDRAISVREAALIQSFPMDFTFAGTLTDRARQIGNAVPPRMAEAIGRELVGDVR
ncbi:DNA (cytosine-5-)-methyltransferase [Rhodococcus sp. 15-725-2-2b]|uniref:DNA cytosine methyltransferase n=1 Tax=unclassified Rhodococcus (in: high G+C Gram-positive bacteria) TaxID=192944 RepID=UPI000B9BA228|nr:MULTISPECIES: DNA cytosine methyltransferase [unclassified Rhodococcus (in: high G+C Gram-positive bacteria)]OZC68626.1 DNA (cytosine-5-)-methyltransferase [Rhodococcus sp. 06-469-3-2]OZD45303.1 DNA (cytosine-5-)-methyltransferase [Rhodococcus sp. 06-1477-1A]OZE73026.1 DNA (cytosine-5-)-methyltransferase [Rhodococcus sp. 15-725-2-2b]